MKIPSLTIPVDEIPEPGLVREGDLPPAWLGDSLLDAYTAESPLHVAFDARRVNDTVVVQLQASLDVSFECSRTLDPGRAQLSLDVGEVFQPAGRHALKLDDGVSADDVDTEQPWVFEGRTVDLEPLLREHLLLAQDPYPVVGPRDDAGDADDAPVWTSTSDEVDARWAALADLDLS